MKRLLASFAVMTAGCSFADALPPIAVPGEGAYLSGELIYSLDDKPTPQCHASTIAETKTGLVAAWFGGGGEGRVSNVWAGVPLLPPDLSHRPDVPVPLPLAGRPN